MLFELINRLLHAQSLEAQRATLGLCLVICLFAGRHSGLAATLPDSTVLLLCHMMKFLPLWTFTVLLFLTKSKDLTTLNVLYDVIMSYAVCQPVTDWQPVLSLTWSSRIWFTLQQPSLIGWWSIKTKFNRFTEVVEMFWHVTLTYSIFALLFTERRSAKNF